MRIRVQTAKIYIGGRRRCLSRASAYRYEAIARVKAKYPCDCVPMEPDTGYSETCTRHEWPSEKWAKLVRRLGRFLAYLDRRERAGGMA